MPNLQSIHSNSVYQYILPVTGDADYPNKKMETGLFDYISVRGGGGGGGGKQSKRKRV